MKKKPTLLGNVMFLKNIFMKYYKNMQYKCTSIGNTLLIYIFIG
jgi:hypothetical protein